MFMDQPALAAQEAQLLRQLSLVAEAGLRRVAAQRMGGAAAARASIATTALLDGLALMLANSTTRGFDDVGPLRSANAATLRMLQDTGLLRTYAAAARATTQHLAAQLQRGLRMPAQVLDAATADAVAMTAVLRTSLLQAWRAAAMLVPATELMQPRSPFGDSVVPTAGLAMAVMRAFARAGEQAASPAHAVMQVAVAVARAAVPVGVSEMPTSLALRSEDVLELLLLALAAGTEQLHLAYEGHSKQPLLPSLRAAASSSSGGSSRSSSRKLAVEPHHEELLQQLLGVRRLAGIMSVLPGSAEQLLKRMSLTLLAMFAATTVRANSLSGTNSGSAGSIQRAGSLVPWELALPLQLVLVEVLALAPASFTDSLGVLHSFLFEMIALQRQLLSMHTVLNAGTAPALERPRTRALAQACLESLWLQLGPALLSLCRRHSGEEDDGASSDRMIRAEQTPGLGPREVFAAYADVLLRAALWQGLAQGNGLASVSAVLERSPVLLSIVAEAALRCLPAFRSPGCGPLNPSAAVVDAGSNCFTASLLADFAAEAAAQALPAAPGQQQQPQQVAGQLVAQLSAGLKHTLLVTPGGAGVPHVWQNKVALLIATLSAAHRVLGDAGASRMMLYGLPLPSPAVAAAAAGRMGAEQQLAFFVLAARALAASAVLLREVPLHVLPGGSFASETGTWSTNAQYKNLRALAVKLVETVMMMQQQLQPGGAAGGAVAAGAAGVEAAGLVQLQQRGTELEQQLHALCKLFFPQQYDAAGRWHHVGSGALFMITSDQMLVSASRLRAACQSGELPRLLEAYGGACCAAFPQPGVCGNAACPSLDKFSEAGLASRSCSGCKAVKFCSLACLKVAWKAGHKAACSVLQQRAAAPAPAAAPP